MTEHDHDEDQANDMPLPDELTVLKSRAKMMGLVFSNNIGILALRAKIAAKQAEAEEVVEETVEDEVQIAPLAVANPLTGQAVGARPRNLRQMMQEEQMKLVRLRITCLDEKKKELPGEIFTVANEYLGTVKKFVPFGEVTDDGYHVPFCIYTMLKDRKFLHIRVVKGRNGQLRTESKYVKEFALEVLPQLTKLQLATLAAAQAAAGTFSANQQD